MNAESIAAVLDADIEQWYEAQRKESTVNRNVMAVGLIMCEHMSTHFPLEEAKWFTGSQVSLLGGSGNPGELVTDEFLGVAGRAEALGVAQAGGTTGSMPRSA